MLLTTKIEKNPMKLDISKKIYNITKLKLPLFFFIYHFIVSFEILSLAHSDATLDSLKVIFPLQPLTVDFYKRTAYWEKIYHRNMLLLVHICTGGAWICQYQEVNSTGIQSIILIHWFNNLEYSKELAGKLNDFLNEIFNW